MNRRTLVKPLSIVLIVSGLIGCVSIEASSRDVLSEQESKMRMQIPRKDLQRKLVSLFKERGMAIVDKKKVSEQETILVFKGLRTTVVTTMSGDGSNPGNVSSSNIGSIFYVRIIENKGSNSEIQFLGKPTGHGKVLCSTNDWSEYQCDGYTQNPMWDGLKYMTGKEEAELIRSIVLQLEI